MRWIVVSAVSIVSVRRCFTRDRSPISSSPAATTMSVVVSTSPPNTSAFAVSSITDTSRGRCARRPRARKLPPPRPIASTSGMRKLVRTPPMSTDTAASRGKPWMSMPTSDVVPPMSTTIASLRPARQRGAAHGVGRAGSEGEHRVSRRSSGTISVPSFWLMKNGASTLSSAERPPERGHDGEGEIDQAGVHHGGVFALEKADASDLVRQRQPDARHLVGDDRRRALLHLGGHRREHRADRGGRDVLLLEVAGHVAHARSRRAARSRVRRTRCRRAACSAAGRSAAARSSGQSVNGGSDGRRKPEADRRHRHQSARRSTIALVKCVVPIITARISAAGNVVVAPADRAAPRHDAGSRRPAWSASCARPARRAPSIRTASVLVPPTSMPMRIARDSRM